MARPSTGCRPSPRKTNAPATTASRTAAAATTPAQAGMRRGWTAGRTPPGCRPRSAIVAGVLRGNSAGSLRAGKLAPGRGCLLGAVGAACGPPATGAAGAGRLALAGTQLAVEVGGQQLTVTLRKHRPLQPRVGPPPQAQRPRPLPDATTPASPVGHGAGGCGCADGHLQHLRHRLVLLALPCLSL